jgi:uncharacterized protein involved in exopolysaccharide biosynthesis
MPPALDLSFLRNRAVLRRMVAVTLTCAMAGGLYALLAPKWYRSVLTVVPAKQQKGGISSLLGGAELGGLAAGLADSIGSSADAGRIAAVLQSVAVSDAVIEKFDLNARYGQRYQEGTREELWQHCSVKTLPKPNLIEMSCEDKDPRFVQQMLVFFADYGNQVFRRVGVSSASEEVRFLEKRVTELRAQADEAAARMRDFQEKHRIVDLDSQAKAVVSALAALQGQRISKQLELEYARTFSSTDEATTRQLQSQLSLMGDKLRDLEEPPTEASQPPSRRGKDGGDPSGKVFPAALAVPKLRAEFETLYRDRKVGEATLVFALERLEGARANEARDVSTFLVLDPATLPTRHSRPKLSVFLAVAAALGLAASLAFELWKSGKALLALASGAPDPGRGEAAPARSSGSRNS